MPEKQKPILDPKRELPAPHDMELEAGYADQLTPSIPAGPKNVKHPLHTKAQHIPSWFIIGVVIIIILFILGVGRMYMKHQSASLEVPSTAPTVAASLSPSPIVNISYDNVTQKNVYQNPLFGYTLQYDPELSIQDASHPRLFQLKYRPPSVNEEEWYYFVINLEPNPERYTPREYATNVITLRKERQIELAEGNPQSIKISNSVAQSTLKAIKNFQANSINGVIVEDPGYEQTVLHVYHAKDNEMYMFRLIPGNGTGSPLKQSHRIAFNNLLKGFSFDGKTNYPTTSPEMQACTMDAKVCPDGSAVGRTAPDCEFAACPKQ